MSQTTQIFLRRSMIGRELCKDIPKPKGKHVTTITYVDANLHHDQVTWMALTACLHLVNFTPTHWHTKRQGIVETATFGPEFVAARITTDQIIHLRYTLMHLGVPIKAKSYMFHDNKSVVDSGSFHLIQEINSGFLS